MSYPRQNTIQTSATSSTDAVATVALPSTTTSTPGDETDAPNPISAAQRWRIKGIVASYSVTPTTPGQLEISDGVSVDWTIDVTTALPLLPLDIQCAPGAEVDITLSAVSGAVGHINVVADVEG